ncbi:hypothetical protein A2824_00680 [Candidatus Nomurabacteria bacterium RIFCSPHIGHO2_01_FULL_42_16]|uniref:Uncharacterized protein n=1 Tax=Candidatus Nomurabacteria bacterium RIFCSPHIGHO2_01_FULL_42_16 TaxID=1801743 RepID=A0A1F6VHG6_9BACT|nr:MAG: hypothetical protein A2824_00680 [Candidatus Nomurabacteria bacterium RIFCSPHIGHO2_01_FULL_42_16]
MEGLKELKWFIIVLIGIWVVWFFTGGIERFEEKSGPFIAPPAPLGTGETYGEDISVDTSFLSSGIEGTLISKKCENVPPGTRCNDTRSMTLRITKKSGELVEDVKLSKDGPFKVSMPAGDYIISQKAYYGDVAPYQHPIVIEVRSFNYARIGLVFDNKIR